MKVLKLRRTSGRRKIYSIVGVIAGCAGVWFACGRDADYLRPLTGGLYFTTSDLSENAFGNPGTALTEAEDNSFVVGNSLFRSNWVSAPSSIKTLDGLGPLFNAISCSSCHAKDGRAQPGKGDGLIFRISIPGHAENGYPLADSVYGSQLQDKAIVGISPELKIRISYSSITGYFSDGTPYALRQPHYAFLDWQYGQPNAAMQFSPRIAQQLIGLGLLENVPEELIASHADASDRNGDGISGRINYVWDLRLRRFVVGRFGWKATQPSLFQQTVSALAGDIGITSSAAKGEDFTSMQKKMATRMALSDTLEISDKQLADLVTYLQLLSVPMARKPDALPRGEKIFTTVGCASCHVPKLTTGNGQSIKSLNRQEIYPYTDLLLHDMGAALEDNRADGMASGTEWRTPPLWGIGLLKTVNGHTYLLHDGRARNVEEAILWHGGEAKSSRENFISLSLKERQSLIKFIESL